MVKTNRTLAVVALSIATAHFFITSAVGYVVGAYVGSQVGQVIAQGMIDLMERPRQDAESVVTETVHDMASASEAIAAPWKPVFVILSLPVKPLMKPISSHAWSSGLEALRAKDISRTYLRTELILVDLALNLVNSLVLGLLIFVAFVPLRHNRAP